MPLAFRPSTLALGYSNHQISRLLTLYIDVTSQAVQTPRQTSAVFPRPPKKLLKTYFTQLKRYNGLRRFQTCKVSCGCRRPPISKASSTSAASSAQGSQSAHAHAYDVKSTSSTSTSSSTHSSPSRSSSIAGPNISFQGKSLRRQVRR